MQPTTNPLRCVSACCCNMFGNSLDTMTQARSKEIKPNVAIFTSLNLIWHVLSGDKEKVIRGIIGSLTQHLNYWLANAVLATTNREFSNLGRRTCFKMWGYILFSGATYCITHLYIFYHACSRLGSGWADVSPKPNIYKYTLCTL